MNRMAPVRRPCQTGPVAIVRLEMNKGRRRSELSHGSLIESESLRWVSAEECSFQDSPDYPSDKRDYADAKDHHTAFRVLKRVEKTEQRFPNASPEAAAGIGFLRRFCPSFRFELNIFELFLAILFVRHRFGSPTFWSSHCVDASGSGYISERKEVCGIVAHPDARIGWSSLR